MIRLTELAAWLVAGESPPGQIRVPIIGLLMVGAGIAIISLMWAKRLWVFELIAVGTFFFLLGGTPMGRTVYDWLASTGG